jgi:molybdopterin/thiamine biosynthesis adenylyltransferase
VGVPRRPDLEIVIGAARPLTSAPHVQLEVDRSRAFLGTNLERRTLRTASCHPWVEFLLAAFSAAAAVRLLVGRAFNLPFRDPAIIDFGAIFADDTAVFSQRVDLGSAHLAGAGAIGSHFVRALSTFDVSGVLGIVDPDLVEDGNLSRCDFYEALDVGRPKAEVLAARAGPLMRELRLEPHALRLQELRTSGPWLRQLIVAVDSRRARRALQEEIPCDVFDASTTGIEEVVLHFNSRRAGGACLSCLYHEDPAENAHEEHVAHLLGVESADLRVASGFITADAERRILQRHSQLRGRRLRGVAYDSLFKELCGAGMLGREDGQQVFAPLAFVSALAGTLLAFEFVRRRLRRTVAAAGRLR